MTTQTQARPLFAATLTPHRSLSRNGGRFVVAALAVLCTVPAIVFLSLGAWPVLGFLGLDLVLLWWALDSAFRKSRESETVTLWRDQLEIKHTDGRGRETLSRFNPHFVKLVIERDINERTTGLLLRTRERELRLGDFLSLDDRSSFAKAFGTALRRARG
jgi:uncharacterized membrane protein